MKINFARKVFAIILILGIVATGLSFAQNGQNTKMINGIVMDVDGEPLIGLSVSIKGGTTGTVTDLNGKYALTVRPADVLIFSYLGYIAQEVKMTQETTYNIVMREASVELDDVVVVGYGTQKKVSVIGAVTNAEVKSIQSVPAASLSNSLGGQIPGLITRQYSGEPGFDGAQLYIRGMATFNSHKPLVLVDGVERDINAVNSQEVESFSILKDASATAVYGVRGANGVVLITTKKGVKGKPKVTFRTEFAQLTGLRFPKYVEAYEYATLMNEGAINSGRVDMPWTAEHIQKFRDGSDPYLYPNVDWVNAVYKKHSWQTMNNLNVSGGDERVTYYINVGLTGKDGLYNEDKALDYKTNGGKYRRYNLRSNVDVNITKDLKIDLGFNVNIQDRGYQGTSSGDIHKALRRTPALLYPMRNPDGSMGGAGATEHLISNPYGLATQSGYTSMYESLLQGTLGLSYDLSTLVTKGLTVSGKFAFDSYYYNEVFRRIAFGVKQYQGQDANGEDIYQVFRDQGEMRFEGPDQRGNNSMYYEGAINYNRTFGVHAFTGMFLFNRRQYKDLSNKTSEGSLPYRHQGIAGRLTYGFNSRYLAEFNFGYNGSEQFPKGKRYGFFPSASVGWVVSNESFWNPKVVSNLKLRASAGQVGNDQLGTSGRFIYRTLLNSNAGGYHFGGNQQWMGGIEESQFGMPLRWEISTKYNLGVDFGLFDRLNVQFDTFWENRDDILIRRENIPFFVGLVPGGRPYGNLAEIENKGIDASLEFKHTTSYGLFYSFRGNLTYAHNKIIEDDSPVPLEAYRNSRGAQIGQSWGLIAEGLFQNEDEIANWAKSEFQSKIRPGDIKYRDLNEDGVINENDITTIGYPVIPEVMYGFGATIAYKGFDATVHFAGVANRSVFFEDDGMYPFMLEFGNYNVFKEYYDNRWVLGTDNSNAKYPAVIAGKNEHNYRKSTLYMKNGSYLKLQNAELGYTLPKKWVSALRIGSIRVFTNGTNLLTIDNVKIMDPEMNIGDSYPQQRIINFGAQINF